MIVHNNLDATMELKNKLEIVADYDKYLSTEN